MKGFLKSASIVASGTLFSRLLGLVREQIFAYYFGAGFATDAFQIAFRIPNLLRNLFAEGAMSSALVPIYTKLRAQEGEDRAYILTSNLFTALALLLGIIAILGMIFADGLVSLYAPAFKEVPGKHELTVALTRILCPFLPFVGMAAVCMGILNARDKYVIPAAAPSMFNVMSILAAFTICPLVAHFYGVNPIYGMAIGATLGGLMQWLVQVPALRKEGFSYLPQINFIDPAMKKMLLMMGAGTFGLAATQINILVNSALASGQGDGAVSWLNYAFRLMQFPIGVFGVAISTVTLTRVSQNVAEGDQVAIQKSLVSALRMVFFLTIPSAVGLAVLGIPIISVIYERGKFTSDSTYATSLALAGYSLGLSAYAGVKVLVPALYSFGKARAVMLSSAASVVLNVLFSWILIKPFGFAGLALATSISALLNFALLLFMVNRLQRLDLFSLARSLLCTIVASGVMAIFVYILMQFVSLQPFQAISLTSSWLSATFTMRLLFLLTALLAGSITYGLACKLLGLQEINRITEQLWKRINQCKDRP